METRIGCASLYRPFLLQAPTRESSDPTASPRSLRGWILARGCYRPEPPANLDKPSLPDAWTETERSAAVDHMHRSRLQPNVTRIAGAKSVLLRSPDIG